MTTSNAESRPVSRSPWWGLLLLPALAMEAGCAGRVETTRLAADMMLDKCFDVAPSARQTEEDVEQDGFTYTVEKDYCSFRSPNLDMDRFVMQLTHELQPAGVYHFWSRDYQGNDFTAVSILLDDQGSSVELNDRDGVSVSYSSGRASSDRSPRAYFAERRANAALGARFERARQIAAARIASQKKKADQNAENWDNIWAQQEAESAAVWDQFAKDMASNPNPTPLPGMSSGSTPGSTGGGGFNTGTSGGNTAMGTSGTTLPAPAGLPPVPEGTQPPALGQTCGMKNAARGLEEQKCVSACSKSAIEGCADMKPMYSIPCQGKVQRRCQSSCKIEPIKCDEPKSTPTNTVEK
jgi:hypothetical protein